MKLVAKETVHIKTASDKPTIIVPPGEEFDAPKDIADDLIARGAVEKPGASRGEPAASAPRPPPAPPTGKKLDATIADAIGRIDKDAPDGWNAQGAPSLHALNAMLGFEIAAADRDRVWDEVSKAVKPLV